MHDERTRPTALARVVTWSFGAALSFGAFVPAFAVPDELLAVVDGVRITRADLAPPVVERLLELEASRSEALRRDLDGRVDTELYRAAAAEAGSTLVDWIDREIVGSVPPPTEEEILQAYKSSRDLADVDFARAREIVIDRLRSAGERARARGLADALRERFEVEIVPGAFDGIGHEDSGDLPTEPSGSEPSGSEPSGSEPSASEPSASGPRVAARVGDREITVAEVVREAAAVLHRIDLERHRVLSEHVEVLVNDVLLQREAVRAGTTIRALLEREVGARVAEPGAADARAFYDRYRARFEAPFEEVEEAILARLRAERRYAAQRSYAETLRARAEVDLRIGAAPELVVPFEAHGHPSLGASSAPVLVTTFLDYACDRCREVHASLFDLQRRFGEDEVRIVLRDRPLRSHAGSVRAAEAARAAWTLGAYEAYAEALFDDPESFDDASLVERAVAVGLDEQAFRDELAFGGHRDAVLADLDLCARLGVESTPAVFVDGRWVVDKSEDALGAAVEEALERRARDRARNRDRAETTDGIEAAEATASCCSADVETERAAATAAATAATEDVAATEGASPTGSLRRGGLRIPNAPLRDQDDRSLVFHDDLVRGHTVAVSFFFTTCRTICPPLTANMRQVQRRLGDRVGSDVRLLSVSVDPTTDRPARLAEYARLFQADDGWTFLTGEKPVVDDLLQKLGAFSEDKTDHTPMILVYNDRTDEWTRVHGLADPEVVAAAVLEVADRPVAEDDSAEAAGRGMPAPGESAPGASVPGQSTPGESARAATSRYFPNVPLVTHRGERVRFVDDLMAQRAIVMNVMFAECTGVCPVMTTALADARSRLEPEVAKVARFVSISVDPATDTPERLREFAEDYGIGDGWDFVTGERGDVDAVLAKIGCLVENREAHSNLVFIGNLETGEWHKMPAIVDPATIAEAIRTVVTGDSHER